MLSFEASNRSCDAEEKRFQYKLVSVDLLLVFNRLMIETHGCQGRSDSKKHLCNTVCYTASTCDGGHCSVAVVASFYQISLYISRVIYSPSCLIIMQLCHTAILKLG